MIRTLLFFLSAATLAAQPLSYGVKLATPLTNKPTFDSPFTTSTQSPLTGGPFVELHLPHRFSVEFSALLRSTRENSTMPFRLGSTQNPYLLHSLDRVNTWDFPLLLKYRFTQGRFRPYLGAGAAWSHRRSDFQAFYSCQGPEGSCRPPEYPTELTGGFRQSTLTRFGPAASAGLDIKTHHLTLSPELRWNRSFSGASPRNHFTLGLSLSFGR
ncbi:MAG: porin family protein [Acidobacteria bacterium]|nr:porin family protein [Acidobacteriota bacterium]